MGNRSSSPSQAPPITGDQRNEVDGDNEESITLDQKLQETLIQDFQSKILREEWEGRQRELVMQANEREAIEEQKRLATEKKYLNWKDQNDKRHSHLDDQIEKLRNSFRDTEFSLKYDVKSLQEKMGSGPKYTKTDNTCLDARVNMSKCFRDNVDISFCDKFTEVFEQCVQKKIVQKAVE